MAEKWLLAGRRSSIQIIAEIISISEYTSTSKADIKEKAKISHKQSSEYRNRLIKLGLIQPAMDDNFKNRFQATSKGLQLLATIQSIKAILN